ncbi:MAG: rubredoxin [Candidatus Methanomethylophilus sp.]|nr:rubredoxin [Methanomethylophilus sp.]MDD4669134.1 rubredoxin [Methanomethylophilus sp.]
MSKYICTMCGYIYDEAKGIPEKGVPAGTRWEALPDDWTCPMCGSPKSYFKKIKEEPAPAAASSAAAAAATAAVAGETRKIPAGYGDEDLREMSCAEMAAMCTNLAKGCEKQYLFDEQKQFLKLAEYYQSKAVTAVDPSAVKLLELINKSLAEEYPAAERPIKADNDRGALRVLTWSYKVTNILQRLMQRFGAEGKALLEHTSVYVCDICGFIYIGDNPPAVCPICKVPSLKLIKIPRERLLCVQ